LEGHETWSPTLKESCALRVSEKGVLRTIFDTKGEKVTGGWRKLHNEKLQNLYSLQNIITNVK
jgi:hypothetical protein